MGGYTGVSIPVLYFGSIYPLSSSFVVCYNTNSINHLTFDLNLPPMSTLFDATTPVIEDSSVDAHSLAAAEGQHIIAFGYMFSDFRIIDGTVYIRSLSVAESLGYKRGTVSEKKFRKLEGAVRLMYHGVYATFIPQQSAEAKLQRCHLYGVARAARALESLQKTIAMYHRSYINKAKSAK